MQDNKEEENTNPVFYEYELDLEQRSFLFSLAANESKNSSVQFGQIVASQPSQEILQMVATQAESNFAILKAVVQVFLHTPESEPCKLNSKLVLVIRQSIKGMSDHLQNLEAEYAKVADLKAASEVKQSCEVASKLLELLVYEGLEEEEAKIEEAMKEAQEKSESRIITPDSDQNNGGGGIIMS